MLKHEIIIYEDARGRAPLREYLKKLKSQKDDDSRIRIGKIQDYISLLQEKGTMLPKPVCKHFSDKKHSWLWELRPGGDRVLFFAWTGGAFVLLHAFKRKARKRPTQNFAERNANTKTG